MLGARLEKGATKMPTGLMDLEPERRDAVLTAALGEFAARGYDAASTNVIAREAGISKALMFHYVGSKQGLFLLVCDYFAALLEREYFSLMDYSQTDLLERLRQSYRLQMGLVRRYPQILELHRLFAPTKSEEVNRELRKRAIEAPASCDERLFAGIDETKFRKGLDVERCKQLILWSNVGFANQILDELRGERVSNQDYDQAFSTLDAYLDELRRAFYGD